MDYWQFLPVYFLPRMLYFEPKNELMCRESDTRPFSLRFRTRAPWQPPSAGRGDHRVIAPPPATPVLTSPSPAPGGYHGTRIAHLPAFIPKETSAKGKFRGSPRWLSAGAAQAASLKSRYARPGLSQPGLPQGDLQRSPKG